MTNNIVINDHQTVSMKAIRHYMEIAGSSDRKYIASILRLAELKGLLVRSI